MPAVVIGLKRRVFELNMKCDMRYFVKLLLASSALF